MIRRDRDTVVGVNGKDLAVGGVTASGWKRNVAGASEATTKRQPTACSGIGAETDVVVLLVAVRQGAMQRGVGRRVERGVVDFCTRGCRRDAGGGGDQHQPPMVPENQ